MTLPARVRIRYHREDPTCARLLTLAPDIPITLVAIQEALSRTASLSLFSPHTWSASDDAYVPLESLPLPALIAGLQTRGGLDVCLYSKPPPPSSPAVLSCDSASSSLPGSFFGVGIVRGRNAANHGTVWRTALQLGAAFTFTVGAPYSRKVEGGADVYACARQVPCISYQDEESLAAGSVVGAKWVAIEAGGSRLSEFVHPKHAMYFLGAEVAGLTPDFVAKCRHHVSIDVADGRPESMNVAAAAAVVLWDRVLKARSA